MARTAKRYLQESVQTERKEIKNFYVGIYSRLSVDHHDRKSESVQHQIEMIHQFIRSNNSNPNREMNLIVYDIYKDSGVTGTSFHRKGFEQLMQDVRERKVTCIIVKDLSRFGRDYLETGNLIEKILPFLGCRFIALADQFDSMAPDAGENKLVMHMKNLVNDMYAKDISKRVSIARKVSAQNGSFTGSFAPYGYKVVRMDGLRRLQTDEKCAWVIEEIYKSYERGMSCREIISALYDQKIHSIRDYRTYGHVFCREGEILNQWSESSVYRILHNTGYGENPELAEKVRQRFSRPERDKTCEKTQTGGENIYRNLIYCGNCGKLMHAVYHRKYAYYCRNAYRIDHSKCEKNYIREEQISSFLLEQLKYMLKENQRKPEDLWKGTDDGKASIYMAEMKKIQEAQAYRYKQRAIAYGQYKEGKITREIYEEGKEKRKEQEIFAAERLEEIKKKLMEIKEWEVEKKEFFQSLLRGETPGGTPDFCIVEGLVEKIMVFPDGRMDVVWKKQQL